jgi:hypothetical protein
MMTETPLCQDYILIKSRNLSNQRTLHFLYQIGLKTPYQQKGKDKQYLVNSRLAEALLVINASLLIQTGIRNLYQFFLKIFLGNYYSFFSIINENLSWYF